MKIISTANEIVSLENVSSVSFFPNQTTEKGKYRSQIIIEYMQGTVKTNSIILYDNTEACITARKFFEEIEMILKEER